MFPISPTAAAAVSLLLLASPVSFAQSDAFHRAYYLEHEKQDYANAARLYEQVIANGPPDLSKEAQGGLEACREELASRDFARLMRPETIAYVELSRPGQQLAQLADQLGLLRSTTTADGSVGVSPALLEGLFGVRGAALGLSGFDAVRQVPRGILIAHPGNVEVVRGLIQSALPIAATAVDPIRGCSTYAIERDFKVYITLTSRLVLVSPQKSTIAQTIERLRGDRTESLADVPELEESLARRGEGLIYFGVNLQRLLPVIQPLIAMRSEREPELRMMLATCDLQSFESISGRIGFDNAGLTLDIDLELRAGHRNLVFNFFRMPAMDRETLRCVPHGVAGFLAGSLNERRSLPDSTIDPAETPVVSFMDIGREVFGNVVGVAAFATKTDGELIAGEALPGIALVFTVNDPVKTEGLWSQFLGIASCAGVGGTGVEGTRVEIGGSIARRYDLPEGVSVFLARSGRAFVVSPSQQAIRQSLEAVAEGRSVLDDPAFQPGLDTLQEGATFAGFLQLRRGIEIARAHLPEHEQRETAFLLPILDSTLASFTVTHSDQHLHGVGVISGIPSVGPLLDELVAKEIRGRGSVQRPRPGSRPEH